MTTITAQPPPKTLSQPEPNRSGRRALAIVASLAVLGLALSVFLVSSLALFTDVENVGGNTFGTGNVDIATDKPSAVVTLDPMAPGDQVTAPILVSNAGSLDLRYALTSTTDEDVLAAALVLTVRDSVTTCNDASWDADGNVLYSGALGATAPATGLALFGDILPGAQGGDRALASGGSETLCFNVTLPLAATSLVESLTTTATFNFVAEQTKNN